MLPKKYLTHKGKKQPLLHWALELECSTGTLWKYCQTFGEDQAITEFLKKKEALELKKRIFSHVGSKIR